LPLLTLHLSPIQTNHKVNQLVPKSLGSSNPRVGILKWDSQKVQGPGKVGKTNAREHLFSWDEYIDEVDQ